MRRGFYLDSVALMRVSGQVTAGPGVVTASLMIGTEANKRILDQAGLLADDGRAAGANDLIIALKADDETAGEAALAAANALLERPGRRHGGEAWRPRTLQSAARGLAGANLAIVSVPGGFAASEARKALAMGLHVMIFSDNVALEDECALKAEGRDRGLLVMGPDCGSALIGGVPLAFANEVPRGDIGIIAASGTGLQEVSSLIARGGGGVSHGIGVGGRDLDEAVAGITTLMAMDALDGDESTRRVVLVSKPPAASVAARVMERVAKSPKPYTVCFVGGGCGDLPGNATAVATLHEAALDALGTPVDASPAARKRATAAAAQLADGRRWVRGLYAGGTLCAEAQAVFRAAGEAAASNAPIPGAASLPEAPAQCHTFVDLGADEFTVGRPHPMIDPAVRSDVVSGALRDPTVAAVLLDVVIGYGAHADPAGAVVTCLDRVAEPHASVIASVCGTERDPQVYSRQVEILERAGVTVAASNAQAAALALDIARRAA